MKRVIATAAVLLAAFGLASEVQAHDHGHESRGWQDRGGHDYRPNWNSHGHDYGHNYGGDHGRDGWHGSDGWHDRDEHRWGAPYDRDYGYRYPRYYYSSPYYGYGWRYYQPPVYRGSYYYDCDDYDYDCDDDGFSLMFSLPLR
jgi:hypothetical protein